jgi:hypothetical protein
MSNFHICTGDWSDWLWYQITNFKSKIHAPREIKDHVKLQGFKALSQALYTLAWMLHSSWAEFVQNIFAQVEKTAYYFEIQLKFIYLCFCPAVWEGQVPIAFSSSLYIGNSKSFQVASTYYLYPSYLLLPTYYYLPTTTYLLLPPTTTT